MLFLYLIFFFFDFIKKGKKCIRVFLWGQSKKQKNHFLFFFKEKTKKKIFI